MAKSSFVCKSVPLGDRRQAIAVGFWARAGSRAAH